MAEKESDKQHLDQQQQQQVSEKQKSQVAMFGPASAKSCKSAQLEPQQPTGFYQNMTTKSKLILPTALWLLIIVAGACFLGLLSSLSRTLSTLDTLVEIEQQKEHEAHLRQHAKAQKLDSGESSWLTQAEPARYKLAKDVGPVNSMMEEVMRALGEPAGELAPVSGSIIVTSSGPGFQSSPAELEAQGMVDSLVKQMFDSSRGQKEPETGDRRHAPLITANIDKVNINIKEPKAKPEPTRGQRVEQSIDGLIDMLIHSNGALQASGPESGSILMPLITPPMRPAPLFDERFVEPPGPMRVHLGGDAASFFGRGLPAHHHAHHAHHHHAHPHSWRHTRQRHEEELAPLLGANPDEPRTRPDLMLMVPEAPMFGRPTASQPSAPATVVIASLDEPRLGQPATPPQSPPYELLAHEHHRHAQPHRAPLDAGQAQLEADLASSLAQTLLQALEPRVPNHQAPVENSLVLINGEPLLAEEPNAKKEPANRNQVSDLFNLFFGPPPNSKLVVAQPHIVDSTPLESLASPKAKQNGAQATKQEQPTTSASPAEEARRQTDEGAASQRHSSREEAAEPRKKEEQFASVDDLLGFFSLPQMNSQSQPQRVGGQEQTSAELKLATEMPTTTTTTTTLVANSPAVVQETQTSEGIETKEPASTTEISNAETSMTTDDQQETTKGPMPMSELAQAFFESGTSWIKNKLFPESKTPAEEPAQEEVVETTMAPTHFEIPDKELFAESFPPSNLIVKNLVTPATPDFETTTASLKGTPTTDNLSTSQSLEVPKAETKSLALSQTIGETSTTPTSQSTKQSIIPDSILAKSEQSATTTAPVTAPTVVSSTGVQPTTIVEPEMNTSNSTPDPTVSPASMKAFFKKADDFIEKGLATFKRFL